MMLVDDSRPMMTPWMLALGVSALMIACSVYVPHPKQTRFEGGRDVRAELINEAESNYRFGSERDAIPVDTTYVKGPGGRLPTITIATATQKSSSDRVRQNKFVSRLNSSGAFPRLGLAPGDNYLWHDTTSGKEGPWRTLVVPRNQSYPMVWLLRDMTVKGYAPGTPLEPRLVMSALGFGTCDHNCDVHCVSQQLLREYVPYDSLTVRIRDWAHKSSSEQ